MSDSAVLVVLLTAPPASADALATLLIDRNLAACVQIVPAVTSVYRWEGATCRETESLLIAKCAAAGFEELRAAVVEAHPYDVPEVIAWPVERGHPPYLAWVRDPGRSG